MLLDDLVRTSEAVAANRSRLAKVNELAGLLLRLDPADIPTAVGLLTAKPRQGRVGIGWSGMRAARGEPAPEPNLTIAHLDAALDQLLAAAGAGSTVERAATLRTLMEEATEREQSFIAGVLLFLFGSGPIRGFAVVLIIGLFTSVFTAVTLTRMWVAGWLRKARPADLNL